MSQDPWVRLIDNDTGFPYMWNTHTGESKWETSNSQSKPLNRDYESLAHDYKQLEEYRDWDKEVLCAHCQQEIAQMVMLPCEHKCLCVYCTESQTEESTRKCVVCYETVLKVVHVSNATPRAVPLVRAPKLPEDFSRKFHENAQFLEQWMQV